MAKILLAGTSGNIGIAALKIGQLGHTVEKTAKLDGKASVKDYDLLIVECFADLEAAIESGKPTIFRYPNHLEADLSSFQAANPLPHTVKTIPKQCTDGSGSNLDGLIREIKRMVGKP